MIGLQSRLRAICSWRAWHLLSDRDFELCWVNPADDIQVSACADWAKQACFHTAYVVDDAQLAGLGVSSVFRSQAAAIGLNVLGSASIPADTTDYTDAATIAALHPDVLYYAGMSASHPGRLLRALTNSGSVGQVMERT